jgi:hypothetical protein
MKWSRFIQSIFYLKVLTLLTLLLFSHSLKANEKTPPTDIFVRTLFSITEIMVSDVASPPNAARFYAYSTLAAHLTFINAKQSNEPSLLEKSNYSFLKISSENIALKSPEFASVYAMLEVAKQIMPSGLTLESQQDELIKQFIKKKYLNKKDIDLHISYSKSIANQIVKIAKADGYLNLSSLKRYEPKNKEGFWYPTPPAYMQAVDPDWKTIKPFFIQNPSEFEANPPITFSSDQSSPFMQQALDVYEMGRNLDMEQKLIANFWDCNPFNVKFSGHMAIGIKKISPGGHWMGITGIASLQSNLNWKETLYIHSLIAMSLHDSFISCWNTKYATDRVRPESIINEYIDPNWKPLLQTPPFPEYTSGHSVISTSSSRLLTLYFGDNFEFIDDTEVYFGLPKRKFQSFNQAAHEAAISRLYGGIHFKDAVQEGVNQGEKIAEYIINKIK